MFNGFRGRTLLFFITAFHVHQNGSVDGVTCVQYKHQSFFSQFIYTDMS